MGTSDSSKSWHCGLAGQDICHLQGPYAAISVTLGSKQEDKSTERWVHLCPCASQWAGDPSPVWHMSDRKGCHERVSLDTPEARATDGDITSFTANHQPGGSPAAHGSLLGSCG